MQLLHQTLAAHAQTTPDLPAWQFAGEWSSWAQAHQRVQRIAASLRRLGLQPGERVGVFGDNSADLAELFIALSAAALVTVPVNPRLVGSEIEYICREVQARCLVVTAALAPKLQAREGEGALDVPLRIGLGNGHGMPIDYSELLRSSADIAEANDLDAIRAIKYTSGTTGTPKGCISTHRQFLGSIDVYLRTVPFRPDDRALLALPMTAGVGMYLLAAYVTAGIPTVIHPRFDATRFLEDVARHRVTRFYGMPTMLGALARAQAADPHDVSSLRIVGYGGSPAAMDMVRHAAATLQCGFYQTFGASEAGGFITYLLPQRHPAILQETSGTASAFGNDVVPCGTAAEGVELRVVDANGNEAPEGAAGEMWVRSDSLMSGYLNRPADTAEALQGGWLMSGDMVVRDAHGLVSVVDRKRDMIISGGYNVYSSEVEATLQRHPGVAEAAVVGVPDAYWGESVVAFVTPAPGHPFDEQEVATIAERYLASYKRPRAIFLAPTLPKTSTGKIRKTEMREHALRLWRERLAATGTHPTAAPQTQRTPAGAQK
jgi:long-chain acyl-CoA synthetase